TVVEDGIEIGKVKEILQPGANDVWVIKRKGKKDLLLPFIKSVVLSVDIAGNCVTVEVPQGLDD
ncbi:MAG: PRC-barrel domain-containing protein, partial [Lactococcus plantarum]|nr:PRC-barrel domain-containing protein [Lactococcus plantarum]